jgi:exodeoxyribonuclease VII small subunit
MSEPTNRSFEDTLGELEGIVRELEDGSTGLEQALARYEAGVGLLKECYAKLRAAEQRVLKLAGTDEEGAPKLEPFAHSSAVEVEAPPKRRKRGE